MRDSKKQTGQIFHIRWLCIAFIILVAGLVWAVDFSHLDDVTYNEVSEKDAVKTVELKDSDSPYDSNTGDTLVIEPGEGQKMFTGEVDLRKGDVLKISFTAVNKSEKKAKLHVDLYGIDYDDPYNEFEIKLPQGETEVLKEIAFYRNEHPDTCSIRFFTSSKAGVEIRDLEVDYSIARKNDSAALQKSVRILQIISIAALAFLVIYALYGYKTKAFGIRRKQESSDIVNGLFLYIFVILSVTAFLLVLYRKAKLSYPLIYAGGDEVGVFYYAKNIDQNGLSLANPFVGGLSGGDMFDYPYSDKLSFLLVKIIGLFTDNPYIIINLFYFLNYYLIAIITTAVSRKLGLSRLNAYLVGILYAFSPYIQMRYTHMWLIPYFMIPVACLMAIHILQGRIPGEEDSREKTNLLWGGVLLAFICAFTGLYYAYFACALFAVAMVVRIINTNGKDFRKELYPMAYIASTVTGVIINVLPNLVYWRIFGTNPYSELTRRTSGDSEIYGLKLVQMILPRTGHRIDFFRRITGGYNNHYPLITENMTAALGIIASIGLMLSLFLLFSEKNKYREISYLNLSTFIIATIGGIGAIISVAVSIPMRCYNRMSLIIMFLSLLFVAMLLDRFREHINPVMAVCISLCVVGIGIFDQTVDYTPIDYDHFNNTKQFLHQVDDQMDDGDMVFTLPYDDWPTSGVYGSYGQFIGYLETDNLHWSYGALQGREEALWQSYVTKCELPDMLEKIQYAGYKGIYLNKNLYSSMYGDEAAENEVKGITELTSSKPMVSKDGTIYFWKIDNINNSI